MFLNLLLTIFILQLDSLGNILDLRNKEKIPCLSNFSKKSSRELKEMCLLAIQNQMQQLAAAEGDKCKLYSSLRAELAEVRNALVC